MSSADTLAELAAQHRAEMRECEKARREMWLEFVKRIREQDAKDKSHA
jgi:hypothetical protein